MARCSSKFLAEAEYTAHDTLQIPIAALLTSPRKTLLQGINKHSKFPAGPRPRYAVIYSLHQPVLCCAVFRDFQSKLSTRCLSPRGFCPLLGNVTGLNSLVFCTQGPPYSGSPPPLKMKKHSSVIYSTSAPSTKGKGKTKPIANPQTGLHFRRLKAACATCGVVVARARVPSPQMSHSPIGASPSLAHSTHKTKHSIARYALYTLQARSPMLPPLTGNTRRSSAVATLAAFGDVVPKHSAVG